MIERRRVMTETKSVDDYLTFTALKNGTVTLTIAPSVDTSYLTSVAYSLDDGATWVTTNNTSSQVTITTPTVTAGSTVKWKGIGTAYATGIDINYYTWYCSRFTATGSFSVSGNIMSLLFGDDYQGKVEISKDFAFSYLFYLANGITDVSNLLLPATTLGDGCYYSMFRSCTDITTAPVLPATTLANNCYAYMFWGCWDLTTAPELPATTLKYGCYNQMFYGCDNLNSVKCLATNISASSSTSSWLYNTASSGTFTKKAGVSWPSGDSGIPSGWTVVEV